MNQEYFVRKFPIQIEVSDRINCMPDSLYILINTIVFVHFAKQNRPIKRSFYIKAKQQYINIDRLSYNYFAN